MHVSALKQSKFLTRHDVGKGIRFGRLTVLGTCQQGAGFTIWDCRCDCGKVTQVRGGNLRSGHTRSCGCISSETTTARNLIHGKRYTPAYATWCKMRERCENPRSPSYRKYGACGIKVCQRWLSFENFLADMGERPSTEHSLDRYPNKFGDYEPGNCRWATQFQQQNNRKDNRILTHNGEAMTVSEWSRKVNIKPSTILRRLGLGWETPEALFTPTPKQRKEYS